jgi:hypothetical protein
VWSGWFPKTIPDPRSDESQYSFDSQSRIFYDRIEKYPAYRVVTSVVGIFNIVVVPVIGIAGIVVLSPELAAVRTVA